MDEFGSRIQHSDEPTVRMVPFYFTPTGTAYSIFWPLTDLKEGGEAIFISGGVLAFSLFFVHCLCVNKF